MALKKQFNAIKKSQFPWIYEVTKYACQQPFIHLNKAWERFFNKVIVNGKPAETFEYKFTPPAELWRVVGSNGSLLTEKFQIALDAFQMGGERMVKIGVIFFED